ncbi:MAG: biotin transporter BioY [Actinomycetia bacterium]|nr:biotin transporter BioY [Actinomycetes bacterium]
MSAATVWVIQVTAFALLTALFAQFTITLPFTPVPITGQTFAVLLTGATLGMWAGGASQLLYLVLGTFMPFYAGGASGTDVLFGANGGYLFGFVVAAALVGKLAERHHDRRVISAVTAFLTGSLVIYFFGVIGLMAAANMDVITALEKGVVPFIVGDVIKAYAAGLLLPAAWRLTKRNR